MTEVCRTALFRAKELNLTRRRLEMSCVEVKALQKWREWLRQVVLRSNYRQFDTGAEASYGCFGTSAKLSGHFGPASMVPKCLGSEVSRVRSVCTPLKARCYFRPCRRKIAQFATCPSTGTDKSGKLTLFSVPANINSPDGVTQRYYYTN